MLPHTVSQANFEKILNYFQITGINRAENRYTVQGGHPGGESYKALL
jgi:hypothetical protein